MKKLEDMQKEEWEQESIKPAWEITYKDMVFTAYENSFWSDTPILSCYVSKNGKLLEHSGRTRYFTKEKALKELKSKYEFYLQSDVIKTLKEKSSCIVFKPYIQITIDRNKVSEEEWNKIIEYFKGEQQC